VDSPDDRKALLGEEISFMECVLFTVSQVADMLDISTKTVLRWVHAQEIPHFRFSSRIYRFSKEEVLYENKE